MSEGSGGRPWFAAKTFGIGAEPATWQGWSATALFVLLVTATVNLAIPRPNWLGAQLHRLPGLHTLVLRWPETMIVVVVEVLVFVALVRWKSDGPWLPGARR